MPLHNRRPKLLPISVETALSAGSSPTDLRTPLPIPSIPSSQFPQGQAMAMTPDTPAFDIPSLEAPLLARCNRERHPSAGPADNDVEWTEYEDGLLQTYLLAPSTVYPPGTLPPPHALDRLTTQIISRVSSKSSLVSSSSIDSIATEVDEDDIDADIDIETGSELPIGEEQGNWRHSWSATRKRLFDIAMLESREAVGGHRRDPSESLVPFPRSRGLQRPKLAILRGQGMGRHQHSMESLHGDVEQSITEAVRLSGNLQANAMSDPTGLLHSNNAFFSPITHDFTPKVPFRKPIPSFAANRTLPRPSLLQRGHSYTGEDLACVTGLSSRPSRDKSRDDDSARPVRSPVMERSVSSPTALFRPVPMVSISSQATKEDIEPDPCTPLHQLSFPTCFPLGLGPFRPGEDEALSPATTIGSMSSATTSETGGMTSSIAQSLTLTVESPTSDADGKTPRHGSALHLDGASPSSEFASLAISSPFSSVAFPTDGPSTTSLPNPPTLRRTRRPVPLQKSESEYPHSSIPATRPLSAVPVLPSLSASVNSASVRPFERERENKRQRVLREGVVFRPRLNPGLSVMVPNEGGSLGGQLRSPFEHKPALRI